MDAPSPSSEDGGYGEQGWNNVKTIVRALLKRALIAEPADDRPVDSQHFGEGRH
jgi:hypothetical protein